MNGLPRWSERLLSLLPAEVAEEVGGDLHEEWSRREPGLGRSVSHALAVSSVVVHFLVRGRARFDWRRHFRLAFRRLRHEPTFSFVAVTAIGLGIGVNVLMLAVAETVLFAPLPYPEEDRLAVLSNGHAASTTGGFGLAYDNIRDVEERSRGVEAIALYLDWQDVTLQADDRALRLPAAFVSRDYGEVLGLRASLGRLFTAEETRENAPSRVAVLPQGTWRTVFGADPDILGRTLVLNGEPFEVVGVTDDDRGDLRYLWGQDPVGVYLPLFSAESLIGFDLDGDRGNRYMSGVVRVGEGTSIEQAAGELVAISGELAAAHPRTNEGWSYHLEPLDEAMYEQLRAPTRAVLGISALVLLLVAVNLLTLILLRAAGRTGETALRRALGAGRTRIVGQLLAESTVLALLGWGVGIGVGIVGLELLGTTDAVRLPGFATLALDWRVATVSALAAASLALLLGLAPAVSLLRAGADHGHALRGGARGSADRGRVRLRAVLVATEVAVACVLLVGAGLLLESFRTLRGTGHGFDTERLVLAQVDVRNEEFGTDQLISFTTAARSAAADLTGVEDAFIWSPNRLGQGNQVDILAQEGRWEIASDERIEASQHDLRPGTLARVGIPLLSGRDVTEEDRAEGPRVALVSESLAQALWPGENPLGRRMETESDGALESIEVVGVVADARHRTRLVDPFEPQRDVYYPFAQNAGGLLTIAIRHQPDASVESLAGGVRDFVREMSPSSPVYGVTTMEEKMRAEEGPARMGALLVGVYAVLAVALAALGLYGVLAHGVRLQLREIGIRMALGAQRDHLVSRVVYRGMAMAGVGLVVGVLLAVPAGRLLGGALYGIEPSAPRVYLVVIGALALVALASCSIPAARAVRIAPSDVLRAD